MSLIQSNFRVLGRFQCELGVTSMKFRCLRGILGTPASGHFGRAHSVRFGCQFSEISVFWGIFDTTASVHIRCFRGISGAFSAIWVSH